jgi:environmental stress-induced protein Ves
MWGETIIIRRSQWITTPWRNGQGMSSVIWTGDREPLGLQVFRTPILASAPFSDFSGYDRIFTIVDGSALTLTLEGQPKLVPQLQPTRFRGEAEVAVSLSDGPAEVLNIIYDRSRWREAAGTPVRHLTIAHALADGDELAKGDTVLSPEPLPSRPEQLQYHLLRIAE